MGAKVITYVVLFLVFCGALINKALAQTNIWSVEAANYVGQLVSFDEFASNVSYNAATKTCLIKLADPDVNGSPVITVIFHHENKGKHLNFLKHLELNTITVTGRLMKSKSGFIINGDDPRTKIVDEIDPINTPVPEMPPVNK
jgi:hypothetical protein